MKHPNGSFVSLCPLVWQMLGPGVFFFLVHVKELFALPLISLELDEGF